MTNSEQKFHNGDDVYWVDPDEGICSGIATFIEYLDEHVAMVRKDGVLIDVYIKELQ
jgi:hypothetical protein|tara:strand:+ start:1315 stop:1485 length:171 start_codon:yes stop_codon:yes gene_type:complete